VAVPVELPRLGENVTEGTIVRWLKAEGERVEADEPLVEVSTDKIDTELPSPASGILARILVREDQTVPVGTELALIEEEQRVPAAAAPEARAPGPAEPGPGPGAAPEGDGRRGAPVVSPLVRRLARERGVDLAEVRGTGQGGRITKADVLAYLEAREAPAEAPGAPVEARGIPAEAPAAPPAREPVAPAAPGAPPAASRFAVPAGRSEEVPFDRVRRAIAEHMTRSLRTAAHVTNVVEVDMTRVALLRERAKEAFRRREGFSLTFLPFVAAAAIQALRAYPELNAHLDPEGRTATILREVNLGIAVARDEGLIVPVIKGADGLNLVGLARAIHDVAARARTKGGLSPDDVAGGTFTITNGGSFGTLLETPIINQPQGAILGTGAVVKRPAVITVDGADAIAIRHLMYLYLSYDHRWIDGHRAAQFNGFVKRVLEEADFADELGLDPGGA
jgi:pyruvate dehydrogenase E2 component (dihydrolipoamide acetyltransferase)